MPGSTPASPPRRMCLTRTIRRFSARGKVGKAPTTNNPEPHRDDRSPRETIRRRKRIVSSLGSSREIPLKTPSFRTRSKRLARSPCLETVRLAAAPTARNCRFTSRPPSSPVPASAAAMPGGSAARTRRPACPNPTNPLQTTAGGGRSTPSPTPSPIQNPSEWRTCWMMSLPRSKASLSNKATFFPKLPSG